MKNRGNGDAVNNETSINGIFLGMALCGDSMGSTGNEEKWLGDTGSQIHATDNVGMCVRNQKVLKNEPVKGCSEKIINATTSGNVTVKTDDGVMCELNNIRIVPGLVKNIISINQLRSEGWKIEDGDEGGFNLTRNGQVLKFK